MPPVIQPDKGQQFFHIFRHLKIDFIAKFWIVHIVCQNLSQVQSQMAVSTDFAQRYSNSLFKYV